MNIDQIKKALLFYFITDDKAQGLTPLDQVQIAIQAGATMIQYRNKTFSSEFMDEVLAVRQLCYDKKIPFIINDNIKLASQVMADGVHLGQDDALPETARQILGKDAVIGATVSNIEELKSTDLTKCSYIGTGPVFKTTTKANAKPVKGLAGFKQIADMSPVPVAAIGGITAKTAKLCLEHGASGVAVISFISRAANPLENAQALAKALKG